jgi:hypothetical protein
MWIKKWSSVAVEAYGLFYVLPQLKLYVCVYANDLTDVYDVRFC